MATEHLTPDAWIQGLYRRMGTGAFDPVARQSRMWASEIGRCLRFVVSEKIRPSAMEEKFDPEAVGRILGGTVVENEVVQILRAAGIALRETGQAQAELLHPTYPLGAHPDGTVLPPFEHLGPEAGPGGLEIKGTTAWSLKRWEKEGLPVYYKDQAQTQMGLKGASWCLFIGVDRSNLYNFKFWLLDFSPERFEELEARAVAGISAVESGELPEGEPERGFCDSCPLAMNCKAYLTSAHEGQATGALSDTARLEIEAMLEELGMIRTKAFTAAGKREEELEKAIKARVPKDTAAKYVLEGGQVGVSLSDRSSIDADALRAAHPDLAAAFTASKSVATVKITLPKFRKEEAE